MKTRYSSRAERALFHYGNYSNHEGGKPVCTHHNTAEHTAESKHSHLREITAPCYTDWVYKLLGQYGGFILIIAVSAAPTDQFAYWNSVYTPQGRQIHSTPVFNHLHPPSSRWITCFCTNRMEVWEVTQHSLCVTVININYMHRPVWCERVLRRERRRGKASV